MTKRVMKKAIKEEEKAKRVKPKFTVRVRRFYKNNRIYCILMGISFVCILLIILALLAHFIHQNTANPYGNRLEGIEDHKVSDNIEEVKNKTKEVENVEVITIEQKGKIIWINIKAKPECSLEDLQNIANDTLKYFSPENLSYYDIHYLMTREGKKGYFGDKSSSSSTIAWAKYNLDEDGTNE